MTQNTKFASRKATAHCDYSTSWNIEVVSVDNTIQEAVGEMKAGNEELAVAEGYQKGSGRMTCVILIVGIGSALIAGGCILCSRKKSEVYNC
jgi:hypothetical protein